MGEDSRSGPVPPSTDPSGADPSNHVQPSVVANGVADDTLAPQIARISWAMRLGALLAVTHVFVICLSMANSVGTSSLQASVLGWADLYLRPMQFSADDAPVFLASGTETDQTLRLDFQPKTQPDPVPLTSEFTPGLAADDRQQRFLASISLLAEAGQDSLVAELLVPVIADRVEPGGTVTLRREPTLLTNALQDEAPPPYQARVIDSNLGPQLLRIQPKEQLAIAIEKQP